jgi:hypothetical protein
VVIVASLIPVGISRYGVTGHDLWLICSIIFLLLMWTMSLMSLRKSKTRELLANQVRDKPLTNLFFWFFLEAPIHAFLVLAVLGIYPELGPAFYTTALLFNLFEAVFVLVQIVHYQMSASTDAEMQDESHVIVH